MDLAALQATLKPHLKKLTPKLLRACHDPNPQTREQMELLWKTITGGKAEGRNVVKENLKETIASLCKDATSKLWRSRVGGCGALAEVIVGRSWAELGGGGAILDEVRSNESREEELIIFVHNSDANSYTFGTISRVTHYAHRRTFLSLTLQRRGC